MVAGRSCCRFGLHIHEVVEITEWHGAEPVIGLVDDMDAKWGLMAIVWMNGSRTWYLRIPCEAGRRQALRENTRLTVSYAYGFRGVARSSVQDLSAKT